MDFSKEFYHWLADCHNEAQLFGYDFGLENTVVFTGYEIVLFKSKKFPLG
jgi:hypothetical protein